MNLNLRTALLIGVITAPMLAHAASFDCAKAASATEKLICGNTAVSLLDEQLGQAYKQALTNSADKDSLKQQQVEWLKQQRACKDAECLTQTYQARIEQLKKVETTNKASELDTKSIEKPQLNASAEKPIHFKLVYGDSYPLCKPYIDMLNATHYTKMPVCERKILPEFDRFQSIDWIEIKDKNKISEILKDRVSFNYLIRKKMRSYEDEFNEINKSVESGRAKMFYHKADINKDGKEDFFYKLQYQINVEGNLSCSVDNVYYINDSQVTFENINKFSADPYFSFNLSGNNQLFYFNGKIYNSYWGQGGISSGSNLDVYESFLPFGQQKTCGILAE
jgi:uncharacterized protein